MRQGIPLGGANRRTSRHGRAQLAKANLLYDLLENSRLFHGTAQAGSRSIANVTFRTGDADLDAAFVAERPSTRFKTSRAIAW